MYDFPIALQLYSVRTDMEADFKGTLKKVKSLGYNGVEFAGLFGHSAEEVKNMCIEIGRLQIHCNSVDKRGIPCGRRKKRRILRKRKKIRRAC